jgi:hypothetical protein
VVIRKMTRRQRNIVGWVAVGLSTLAASFWAFWGILESFHEGWYGYSVWQNLVMVAHYLLMMTIFVVAALVGIRWPAVGGGLHLAAALAAGWFFRAAAVALLYPFIVGPLVVMATGYWLGRPQPRRWAVAILVGLPLLTIIVFGAEPAYRVSRRVDDGDRSARRLTGNGVDLIWAPEGPGWPRDGVTWEEAQSRCRHLTEDGMSLADAPLDIWRLPTVEEAVRSMHRHGRNCGGIWDAASRTASYERRPDKESPLWDVHSPVIYWWTATEVNEREALIIVYDGKAWPRPKSLRMDSLAFRAVRRVSKGK